MRSMLTALVPGLCVITALGAETGIPYSPLLTVLLSVDGKLSDTALGELKSELNDIMKDTGRRLDLRRRQADKYLGRALGRVLAHELYHILGKTHQHNQDGSVAKEAISAKQLISDERLGFDLNDLYRMLP